MPYLSIVLPLFNESSLIQEIVTRVKDNAKIITDDFEIIMVDDGSQDKTWESIKIEASKEQRVKGVRFSRNFGHHYAITAGLHKSMGEWVVVMDSDLQDRPEVIPELYRKAQEGFDVVFVSRKNRPEKIYYKMLQKIFYKVLNYTSGIKFNSKQANFSIINRKVVESFKEFPENSRFYSSTIKWLGYRTSEIEANHGIRFNGKPSYTFKTRVRLALDIIIAFSERPMKLAIVLVLILSGTTTLIGLRLFIELTKNSNDNLLDNFIMVFILLVLTFVLMFLGLIGVYIQRIFKQVKNRPLYIVMDRINL
jgi:glycosyltransferase involved in cell wall biosynthesis